MDRATRAAVNHRAIVSTNGWPKFTRPLGPLSRLDQTRQCLGGQARRRELLATLPREEELAGSLTQNHSSVIGHR